jgi:hypothetical protein
MKIIKIALKILGFFAILALYVFAAMSLWNYLVPTLFKLPLLSFWQTLGLIVLLKMFFLGNGWGKRCHCHKHKHFKRRRKAWRKQFYTKFNEQKTAHAKSNNAQMED